MSFKVSTTAEFESDAKILQKRHRSFKNDLKDLIISLEENPFQGVELSPGIRKIRMAIASKGRGKSGGRESSPIPSSPLRWRARCI